MCLFPTDVPCDRAYCSSSGECDSTEGSGGYTCECDRLYSGDVCQYKGRVTQSYTSQCCSPCVMNIK